MPKATEKSKGTGKKWMQKAVKRPGALSYHECEDRFDVAEG